MSIRTFRGSEQLTPQLEDGSHLLQLNLCFYSLVGYAACPPLKPPAVCAVDELVKILKIVMSNPGLQ